MMLTKVSLLINKIMTLIVARYKAHKNRTVGSARFGLESLEISIICIQKKTSLASLTRNQIDENVSIRNFKVTLDMTDQNAYSFRNIFN